MCSDISCWWPAFILASFVQVNRKCHNAILRSIIWRIYWSTRVIFITDAERKEDDPWYQLSEAVDEFNELWVNMWILLKLSWWDNVYMDTEKKNKEEKRGWKVRRWSTNRMHLTPASWCYTSWSITILVQNKD
jgi:hypothetical protein